MPKRINKDLPGFWGCFIPTDKIRNPGNPKYCKGFQCAGIVLGYPYIVCGDECPVGVEVVWEGAQQIRQRVLGVLENTDAVKK